MSELGSKDSAAHAADGPEERPKYSVGHLRNPRPEDKRFRLRFEAIDAAFAGSKDEDVWAVWFGDNVVVVVYDGESFS